MAIPQERICVKKTYITIVMAGLIIFTGCTNLIFQPRKSFLFDISKTDVVYQDVFIPLRDGVNLHGWWLSHANPDYKGTVVFLHGNAGNISFHMGNAYWMVEHGYNVLLFDYRGFGKSQGYPDLPKVVSDVDMVLAYALNRIDNKKLIVFSQSLGASIGIYAVANSLYRENILAFISISAFHDYQEIAQELLSNSWITWLFQWPLSKTVNNDYAPIKYVGSISPIPVMIAHSRDDEIIPYHHGLELFAAALKPKVFIELQGDHNHIFLNEANQHAILDGMEKLMLEYKQ